MDLKTMERYIRTGWDRDCCGWNHTEFAKQVLGINDDIPKFEYKPISYKRQYEIEKVVFNPPATIILWADKTKTIVKAQGDEPFDPEKGMAMAFMKKVRGNTGAYNKEVNKWVKPYEEKQKKESNSVFDLMLEQIDQIRESICKNFEIPIRALDENGCEKDIIESAKNDIPKFEKSILADYNEVLQKTEEEVTQKNE